MVSANRIHWMHSDDSLALQMLELQKRNVKLTCDNQSLRLKIEIARDARRHDMRTCFAFGLALGLLVGLSVGGWW